MASVAHSGAAHAGRDFPSSLPDKLKGSSRSRHKGSPRLPLAPYGPVPRWRARWRAARGVWRIRPPRWRAALIASLLFVGIRMMLHKIVLNQIVYCCPEGPGKTTRYIRISCHSTPTLFQSGRANYVGPTCASNSSSTKWNYSRTSRSR